MVIFSRSAPSNSSLTNSRISSFVGGDFFAFLLSGSSSDESPESAFFSKKILDEIHHFSSTVPEWIALDYISLVFLPFAFFAFFPGDIFIDTTFFSFFFAGFLASFFSFLGDFAFFAGGCEKIK